MTETENKSKEFNEKFLGAYQQELSDPTNKNHQFDSEKQMADGPVTNPATATPTAVQELAASVTKPATNLDLTAFGHPIVDFTNALLPNGAPKGSRHKSAIKLAYDLLIICDGDAKKVLDLTVEIVEAQHLTTLMITHNMKDAIAIGNRLIMMHEGKIIYDVRGEEKQKLTVDDLLKKFAEAHGDEFANDRMMLG